MQELGKWVTVRGREGRQPLNVVIHRSRVMEDALAQLQPAADVIKGPLNIVFVNEHGMREAGMLPHTA